MIAKLHYFLTDYTDYTDFFFLKSFFNRFKSLKRSDITDFSCFFQNYRLILQLIIIKTTYHEERR